MNENYGTPVRGSRTVHCAGCGRSEDVVYVRRTTQFDELDNVLDEFACEDKHQILLPGLDWARRGQATVFDL